MTLFSERLQKMRESMGWTQTELGDKLNLAPSTIHRYENGTRMPDTSTLTDIADLFRVTTDYLLGRDKPLPKDVETVIALKDGRTISIDDLPPEDRRIVEELQAFIAAKLTRTDNTK